MTDCYLCGGTAHRRLGSARDNPKLDVLECGTCSLVFLSSIKHIQLSHYEQSGMHGAHPLPVGTWLREAAADDERRFRFLQQTMAGKRLLDFGCGAGGFLLKAQTMAAATEGVEPELRLQSHFAQVQLKVHKGLEDIAAAGADSFDLVTAFHVVEHLPDPRATLIKLAAFLKKDGELILEVPNSEDALLTLFESQPFSDFTYWSQHLFLFNRRTLQDLVKQTGLQLRWLKQVQRYPLSNHLHWLARGKPGGHQKWAFIDSPALHDAYEAQLAAMGRCDTLLAGIGPLS